MRVERLADRDGLSLLGFYHSHPDHPAVPSDYDREHALPFFHYLVLAVAGGTPRETAAWILGRIEAYLAEEDLVSQELRGVPHEDSSADAASAVRRRRRERRARRRRRSATALERSRRPPRGLEEASLRRRREAARFVNVYKNDEDVRYLQKEATPVAESDALSIIPSIAGGSASAPPGEAATLSNDEIRRYSRHLIMPEVGLEGQKKLKAARVLAIGTGGLGSPLALYLAAAGVGTIGLVDFDVVDDSNLQRQILFGTATSGRPKLSAAAGAPART